MERVSLIQSVQEDIEPVPWKKPLLFSVIVALGPLAFGFVYHRWLTMSYTMGITSPIGDKLQTDIGITSDQQSLFSSIVNVGAMIGALSGGFFTEKLGRLGYF
jgi:SP family sugar porter-like MFS transporter